MPRSDSKALRQPPAISWAGYRQWTRENLPLGIWHIAFLGALLIVARADIVTAVYLALVLFPALVIIGIADARAVLGTWTVRVSLAFLVFLWLTPLWTGGTGAVHWPDTTLALVTVASFIAITAHLTASGPDHQDQLLKVLAIVALVITLYSAIMEYRAHWFTERLVIMPWSSPDAGAAVIGLLITGMAAGPGMNAEEWPGVRMLYWAVAVLLALSLLMTQTFAPIAGVVAAALASALVRPRKLSDAALWGGGIVAVAALLLFLFSTPLSRGAAGWTTHLADFWHLAQDRLWLGFGTEGQVRVWYDGAYLAAPHNMPMTALIYGGALAVVLIAALAVTTIAVGIGSARRGLSPAPLAMAVYVAVYGLFATIDVTTPGWQWLALWLPVGIVAGAELSRRRRTT